MATPGGDTERLKRGTTPSAKEIPMSAEKSRAESEHERTPERPPVDETRRALIRAGWTLPVILAVKLPTDAFAEYAHGDTHHDDHTDAPHGDSHFDHGDHADHSDVPHTDAHDDAPHTDVCPPGTAHMDHIDGPDHADECRD
jgi:hypothetical protein